MSSDDPESTASARPRAVGLREVAERAEVAISSVSRVLADHPDVSERMRRRVLAAAEDLGYEPDLLAQSLRRGETLSVGFVVRDISNPILAEIALGAETTLGEAGYSMLLTNSHGEPDADAKGIRLFRRRRVDGLLLSLSDETHAATRQEIEELQLPIILIDRQLPGTNAPVGAVLSDHGLGAHAAVSKMIEAGHRHIGLIAGDSTIHPMRVIAAAVREACQSGDTELTIEAGRMEADAGEAETNRLLDRPDPPTALLTASNQILVGTLHALRARGLRVPEDISLVTFDDIPLLDLHEPPIGVISRLPLKLGRTAASELLGRLRDDTSPRTVVTPTTFDPRASIAPPPAAR